MILIALLLTLILELIVAWLWRLRSPKTLLTIASVNCLTNPGLNYLLYLYPTAYHYVPVWELLIILIEGILLTLILTKDHSQLWFFTIVANLFSWLFGGYLILPWLNQLQW